MHTDQCNIKSVLTFLCSTKLYFRKLNHFFFFLKRSHENGLPWKQMDNLIQLRNAYYLLGNFFKQSKYSLNDLIAQVINMLNELL